MKTKLDYQDLQASLCEYKINLFRYDAYVRSLVLKQLDQAQKELLTAIIGNGVESASKRQLNALTKEIEAIVDENYEKINALLVKTDRDLFVTAHQAEAFIYNEWLGTAAFTALPKYKLEAIKLTPLFEGRALGDWWNKQQDDLKFNLETIIRNGNLVGESQANIAREVRHRLDITKRGAETLVRTANASIASNAQSRLMSENADLVYSKQQISTLDSRTTPVCRYRDGLRWKLDGTPIGHDVPFRDTPLHAGCRSLIQIEVDRKNKTMRASEFGPVDQKLNFNDWLKQQSVSYQENLLGKQRAKWFRSGKLDLRQMMNQNDRPLTNEQLRSKYQL